MKKGKTVAWIASAALAFFAFVGGSVRANAATGNNVVESFLVEPTSVVAVGVNFSNGVAVLNTGDSLTTKDTFRYFESYVSATVSGAMTLTFDKVSVTYDSVAGFSVTGATVESSLVRELTGNLLFRISVYGANVEVGVKTEAEPQDTLYENILTATITNEYGFSPIALTVFGEGDAVTVDYIQIHTLEQTIETEREDYDPSHELTAFEKKPVKEDGDSCSASVGSASFALIGVAAVLLGKRKRGGEK